MGINPLESIEVEVKDLLVQREQIDRKLAALEGAKKVLQQVYGQPLKPIPTIEQFLDAGDIGITDAVRGAFRINVERLLTATQIRQIVASTGYDLSKYKNAMATIHQVISRLVDSTELAGPFPQGNEKVYQWKGKAGTLAGLGALPENSAVKRFAEDLAGMPKLEGLGGASPKGKLRTPDDV